MMRLTRTMVAAGVVAAALTLAAPKRAQAQMAVTAYYPATPVVTYRPVRRGLFGWRIVYRPFVSYAVPTAPVTTYYAPAPVTTYYAPAPVTTYYAPRPVRTYYAPRPVRTYYAPTPVTTYYAPAVVY